MGRSWFWYIPFTGVMPCVLFRVQTMQSVVLIFGHSRYLSVHTRGLYDSFYRNLKRTDTWLFWYPVGSVLQIISPGQVMHAIKFSLNMKILTNFHIYCCCTRFYDRNFSSLSGKINLSSIFPHRACTRNTSKSRISGRDEKKHSTVAWKRYWPRTCHVT